MSEVRVFKRITQSAAEIQGSKLLRMATRKDIPHTIFLLLASRAGIIGIYPFGVAMFAGVYDKKIAYIGMIASMVGMLSAGLGAYSMKYIFAMVVFWLYTRINENYKANKIVSSAICGASIIFGGISVFTYQDVTLYQVMLLIAEGLIGAFMYVVFNTSDECLLRGAKREKLSQEEIISACIAMGVIITGFSGINLPFGVSMTKLLSAYAVMVIAMHTGLATACAGGLATGIICGMDTKNVVTLMGIYGFCGLLSNLLKSFGKYGIAIGFLSGCAIAMLFEGTSLTLPINPWEVVFAGGLFLLTPNALHLKMSTFFLKAHFDEVIRPDIRIKQYLMMKLENASKAFSTLAETFNTVSEKRLNINSGDVASMFDDTAERVCKKCNMSTHCWQRGFNDTYKNMFILLSKLENKGSLTVGDVPKEFREGCVKIDSLINTFSHIYELYKQNALWVGEMSQGRELMATQYREISNIMNQFHNELSGGFDFMEEMEEKLIQEMDKLEIPVSQVSIIETGNGDLEVYMTTYQETEKAQICSEVSKILDTPMAIDSEFNGNIIKLVSKCDFDVDISVKQLPKEGQFANGDSVVHFNTADNKFIIAISDGMGSGIKAMEQSVMTTELLSDFLKAGFCRSTSVNMINSSLALKADEECFSTIDLLMIDLTHGVGEFIKAGAPESYIKRQDEIETVFSMSLPAGMLTKSDVEPEKRQLNKGDVVVMMSDGVSDAGKSLVRGEWIKKLLLEGFKTADDLAEKIMQTALKRSKTKAMDDMSVAVIKIL